MAEIDPRLIALLAVHNRLDFTRRCIAALRCNRSSLRIVVVNDGSSDGTAGWLSEQSGIDVLKGDGDLWFGGATDLGLRHILARYPECERVLILNNDTFVRPGAIDSMIAAMVSPVHVVAAAYWLEDSRQQGSAGFLWLPRRGLFDVSWSGPWMESNRRSESTYLPVAAIATTLTLIPTQLLRKTRLPNPKFHPHNRYDAILSARLRAAGARFVCSTFYLADHRYGSSAQRPSVRKAKLARFARESLSDRKSIFYLPGNLVLAWETAPSRPEALHAILLQAYRFLRQLAWVTLNSMLPDRIRWAQSST